MSKTEWQDIALQDVASEVTSGATPQSGNARYYVDTGGIPFAKIDDLTAASGAYVSYTFLHVNKTAVRETALKLYPTGTLLLSMYGTVGLAKITAEEMVANQALAALVPPFKCNQKFLYHLLVWMRPVWDRFKAQTTQANINGAIVKNMKVSVPPLSEQRRIAEILDTLDDQIRATEQIIAKLKLAKQGLRDDLLTLGIDETGKIRSQSETSDEFSATVVGPRPKSWGVSRLGDFLDSTDYGISSSLSDSGEVPVLRMNNFFEGEAFLADLKYSDTPEAAGLRLRPGDVLFNRTNSLVHVGRTGIWRGQIDRVSFASYLVRLNANPARLRSEYLNHLLNRRQIQIELRRWATPGVHQVNVNPTNLRKVVVSIPGSLAEQDRVCERLKGQDERIYREIATLRKLKVQKQGLMADLLTGKVRVETVS